VVLRDYDTIVQRYLVRPNAPQANSFKRVKSAGLRKMLQLQRARLQGKPPARASARMRVMHPRKAN